MKIALISGSHRPQSESSRVAAYLAKCIERDGYETDIIDLAGNPLPLWDQDVWDKPLPEPWLSKWLPISQRVAAADAVIVIAPEWSGMVTPALKNFFLLCSAGELAHKPGLIVGVSASINGAYPVAELRSSSYKNTKICYVPDHLIVRNVGKMLLDNVAEEDAKHDTTLRRRIDYTLGVFYAYADALKTVRATDKIETDEFIFGM